MAMGGMANFIFRGTMILVCIILAILLIITPVMIHMWIKIQKAEVRIEKKERQVNRLIKQLQEVQ
jgi:uncharacterized membrane protein YciS (DUF1049 family)